MPNETFILVKLFSFLKILSGKDSPIINTKASFQKKFKIENYILKLDNLIKKRTITNNSKEIDLFDENSDINVRKKIHFEVIDELIILLSLLVQYLKKWWWILVIYLIFLPFI